MNKTKIIAGLSLILVAAAAFYFKYNKKPVSRDDAVFLGEPTTSPAVPSEVASAESFKEEDLDTGIFAYISSIFSKKKIPTEKEKDQIPDVDTVVIPVSDWDALRMELMEAKAKLKVQSGEIDLAKVNAFNEGKAVCIASLQERSDKDLNELSGEAMKLLKEAEDRMSVYRNNFALVNGECRVEMNSGEMRWYVMKDVCVNVVSKKVGNTGEITGILGAVSKDAMEKGIVRMNCETGEAHLKLMDSSCFFGEKK